MKYKRISIILMVFISLPVFSVAQPGYRFGAVSAQFKPGQLADDRRLTYQNMTHHLAVQLKQPVKLETFASYKELKQALEQGKVNLAYYKTGDYVEAKLQNKPVYPLVVVVAMQNGKNCDSYYSYLVTKSPDLKNLASLKNKRFGFNAAYNSMSSYFYPFAYFYANKIDPNQYFSQLNYYSSSYEAMNALKAGIVDAVTIWDDSYQANSKGQKFNILHKMGPIPNPLIVASAQLTKDERKKVIDAFLALPKSAFTGLNFVGIESYKKDFYKSAEAIYHDVNKWFPELTKAIHKHHTH